MQKSNQPNYVTKRGYKTNCKELTKEIQKQVGYNTQYLYRGNIANIILQSQLTPGIKMPLNVLQALAINPEQKVVK